MAEGIIQLDSLAGKKVHTSSYTVGANTVEDEVVIPGPYPYGTYIAQCITASPAASDHILCLNAGASLKVRVHRIRIQQTASATAAHLSQMTILRTTTSAPTGGTAITPAPFDTADTAGAAARSVPGAKGTESTVLFNVSIPARQAILATATQADGVWEWRAATAQGGTGKPILIPTGTVNGLVVKMGASVSANTTWNVEMEFTETAF